ncbi:MAG: replicative DNA helicase [Prevotellaceae bacterium]|nr:replicative DNA helicase [Candidatus Faecinaster equi]
MPETKQSPRTPRKRTATQEENFSHIQPQAIDIERVVLGALMVESEAYSKVGEILIPESFYEKRHQLIFDAIRQLSINEDPVDILTVPQKMAQLGTLEQAGGPAYLAELCRNVTSSAHIEYHAGLIAQKYLARQLITYTSQVQTSAFDETKDVEELLQEAEGGLFEITKKNQRSDFTQIDPVIREAYKMLKIAAGRPEGLSGVASGFHKLDDMTSGWQPSDLIIIAARPAMGKTAFALSMAKNMAIDRQIPVAFFSLEMSNVQLVNRIIINTCSIEGNKLRSGQLAPHEWVQLDSKIKQLIGAPLYVDDTPSLSVFELKTKARRLVREHGVKIIMIDYLQLMNASGIKFGNRQEEVSTISRSLKGLAKELNIPILALSQLNRSVEKRDNSSDSGGKRPQLSDLRESGAIEQDADMVCFIHRPEYYHIHRSADDKIDYKGKAEIIIAKHRNGAVGDVLLKFTPMYARFSNADDDEEMQYTSKITGNDAPPFNDYAPVDIPPEDDPLGGKMPEINI